jgi:hypothetical protein
MAMNQRVFMRGFLLVHGCGVWAGSVDPFSVQTIARGRRQVRHATRPPRREGHGNEITHAGSPNAVKERTSRREVPQFPEKVKSPGMQRPSRDDH